MSDPNATTASTESILKELLESISSLQKEVTELKKDREVDKMTDKNGNHPQKCPRDGDKGLEGDTEAARHGKANLNEGETDSDAQEEDTGNEDHNSSVSYKLSDEGRDCFCL